MGEFSVFQTASLYWIYAGLGSIKLYVRSSWKVQSLDTREGRCGEWANAFGAILRSFDFQVRECHNVFADHVWVEGLYQK